MHWDEPRVALATMHGKERVLAPELAAVGLQVQPARVDTDALGTFSGERERTGTPREVVLAKARLGMAVTGCRLGLATEASFGADPVLGLAPLHQELIAFVDDLHGQVIVLALATHDTNWASAVIDQPDQVEPLLRTCGFPEHAVLVRPNAMEPGLPVAKGLRSRGAVMQAIQELRLLSRDGLVRVEPDMRAHCNPTRMQHLAALGKRLAQRLACLCPRCGVPGFGCTALVAGLPCGECGMPTSLSMGETHACTVCGHEEQRPRADGLALADPGSCAWCNP